MVNFTIIYFILSNVWDVYVQVALFLIKYTQKIRNKTDFITSKEENNTLTL